MRKYRLHEDYLVKSLKNPKEAALYLNAVIEENDPVLLLTALSQVARAHGHSRIAKNISMSRMGLYKSLSKKGNPQLKTFMSILHASGLQIFFKPRTAKIKMAA